MAGEYAVLSTGFRVHAERHESNGSTVTLYSRSGVMAELPASSIVDFEVEEYTPLPPALPVVSPPAPLPIAPKELVDAAAAKHGLPPAFVHSVVAAESAYRVDAVSKKGALGLMQLMPATAQAYGVDPMVPEQNVNAGTKYLRELLLKYGNRSDLALAAYNAGPGAVDRYKGIPPFRETQAYVARVLQRYSKTQK